MGDCELGRADRMGEVDVQAGVAVGGRIVFGRRLAGRVPEVRKGLCVCEVSRQLADPEASEEGRDWVLRTGS